jgi:DNA-binding protein HU-beta
MNKNELISAVAEKCDMRKAQANDAVEAVLGTVTEQLAAGDEVRILGFGNFSVADRKATTARNPRTGETVQVAASKSPKFKAGKALKDAVNG